jgi:hypothetical protein
MIASAFFMIGCATWFFSTRRAVFIRIFAPPEDLRATVRSIPREPAFTQGMRFIALLQMSIGLIMALISFAATLV